MSAFGLCSAIFISLYLQMFDIGVVLTSSFLKKQSYNFIDEYKHISEVWMRERRVDCGKCPPPNQNDGNSTYSFGSLGSVDCELGSEVCYQKNAEKYARLLDDLLGQSSRDDNRNLNVTSKWEKYFEEREMRLWEYPQSWATLSAVAFWFTLVKIVGQVALGVLGDSRKVEIHTLWIGIFSAYFLLLLALLITAVVYKINYDCPWLHSAGNCRKGSKTQGNWFCGMLGANMVLHFFLTSYHIKSRAIKKEESHNRGNEMTKLE